MLTKYLGVAEMFPTRVCPVCGKEFILPIENIYKLTIKGVRVDFCSYTCFRVEEKRQENAKKNNKSKNGRRIGRK